MRGVRLDKLLGRDVPDVVARSHGEWKGRAKGKKQKKGGGAQAECGGGCWEKEKSEEGQRSTSFFLLPFSPLSLSLPVSFFLSLSLSLCQPRSNQQRQRKVEKHNECRNEWYV